MTTVVIGGGLAGLAAAVGLAAKGESVTLLESRSFCGGRAYSYTAPVIGDVVDNGQHVMLGCYHALFRYLSLIGSEQLVDIHSQLALPFQANAHATTWFRCPRLPAPLNLVAGIAKLCGLRDAMVLIRHRQDVMRDPRMRYVEWDQLSCADWLHQIQISKEGVHRFWEPLILAVMNDSPARVSVAPFLTALHRIATGTARDASLAISRVGLSELLVTPALKYITDRGATVRCGVTVGKLSVQDNRLTSLTTTTGEIISAQRVIFAVPPHALEKILETIPGTIALREMLGCWEESPILSVYLWYDRSVMDQAMVGLWGSPFHWVFCRKTLLDRHSRSDSASVSGNPVHGVTLVVSGASDFDKMSREDVVSEAIRTMNRYFPKSTEAQLLHRLVSREPHATVRLAPGTQRLRAAIKSPWANAQFIGDWTDTHLPATIEGAIASGLFAGENYPNSRAQS
jgi:squalene-associated FAD-dependent desaturase